MGSSNCTVDFHVPTIDIAPYLKDPTSAAAHRVVHDVRDACMTVGFFSLVGHRIPRQVQDDVFAAAKKLFRLPIEEKRALQHPMLKNRGYEIIGAQALQDDTLPDLKEVSLRPCSLFSFFLSAKCGRGNLHGLTCTDRELTKMYAYLLLILIIME